MKTIMKSIQFTGLAILAVLITCSASWAATHFVDATSGNDGNDGLSPDTAWKTISKVNSSYFQPGDFILFRRGETWREQLNVLSSGSPGNPITFSDYGTGSKPGIRGADIIKDWEPHYQGVWKARLTTQPAVVFMYGSLSRKGIDVATLNNKEWFWMDNFLFVRDESGNPQVTGVVIEAGQRAYCIFSDNSADNIIIDGLELSMANSKCFFSSQNDDWTIKNCHLHGGAVANLWGEGNPSGAGAGQVSGWVVEDNTVGEIAIDPNNAVSHKSGIQIRGMDAPIIRRNKVAAINSFAICVRGNTLWDGAFSTNPKVYENVITNSEAGIIIRNTIGGEVLRNHIHDSRGFGIQCAYNVKNVLIAYNLIHDLAISSNGKLYNGIDINLDSQDGWIYNNTIYKVTSRSVTVEDDTAPGDGQFNACNGWTVKNNILNAKENIAPFAGCIEVSPGVDDITLSNNNYYFDTELGDWKGSIKTSLMDWNTVSGDTNSIAQDPCFSDPDNNILTLRSDSPCIDAGSDVGLSKDYAGTPIFKGGTVDIGAFEYKPLAPPKNLRRKHISSL